ncbi:hypothetical protein PVAND_002009 [Polypedilum vanderplanki]|uniref:F-box domain-containing protein n=1 Tax=Polypedilum vanderplanki TaxID=319348 RepID=A0A9J6BQX4_POLVA|nr:hypothetical protein PVAND_002009 [Polypedilum vanderplanki]
MNLTDLPNEILIKIFEYCKVLPLTHVSQKFNLIISNSSILMQKFYLVITEKTRCDEITKSERKHQKVLFKYNYKIDNSVLQVFNKYSEIKHVEFMRCILLESTFIEILKASPNIKQLAVFSTYLKSDLIASDSGTVIDSYQLRELNFRNSDQKILYLIKCSMSTILKMNISLPHQYPVSTIVDFLKRHDKIEEIENLTVSEIENTIMTQILCEMKNLKKLSLEAESIKIESIRNLNIENTSIHHLNLYGRTDPMDLNLIMSFFKNLKFLELEVNSNLDSINFVHLQRIGKRIEQLKIKNCSGEFFNHITLPNLKCFEIADVTLNIMIEDWINFARRNQRLEVLKIKDETVSNENFITICQEFMNLKELELFYDPQRLTTDILNYICSDLFPRNIKTLKICKRNRQQYSFFTLTNDHKNFLKNNVSFHLILR